MIVTHFLQKAYRKITEKPATEEEIHRMMKKRYAEFVARLAARPVIAKLDSISTPRDGAKMMSAIGTVQQMRDALRPCRPVDGCDAMAMAPGRFS